LTDFRKIFKYQIPRKSAQWEPICSMPTDITKLRVAFHNFEIALKNCKMLCVILSVLYNQ